MLVKFFKSAQPLQLLGFIVFSLVLWFIGMHFPVDIGQGMPLFFLFKPLLAVSPWVARSVALVLIIGQALLIRTITDNTLSNIHNSLLPSVLFVLLACSFPSWFSAQPYILSNILLILLFKKIQIFYRQENVLSESFDSGLIAGLMTIIYLPSLLMFLLVWTALAVFRPFNWREWIVALLGLLFPMLLLLVWYFFFDGLNDLFTIIIPQAMKGQIVNIYPYRFYLIGLVVLVVPAILVFLNSMGSAGVKVNKTMGLLFWLSLFSISAWLLAGMDIGALYFLCFPLAIIISNFLFSIKRRWIAEISLILLIAFLLYGHFSQYNW